MVLRGYCEGKTQCITIVRFGPFCPRLDEDLRRTRPKNRLFRKSSFSQLLLNTTVSGW